MKIMKIYEAVVNKNIFFHGTTDKGKFGKRGIHIGTKQAATQALQARIGVKADGEWDGTTKYGETLLAGKKTLKRLDNELGYYCTTGHNCGDDVPEEDYYPTQRKEIPTYSNGTKISFNTKPIVYPVKIIGQMMNSPHNPKGDEEVNSFNMQRHVGGWYYINDSEDYGSISAIVPDESFLKEI